MSQAYVDELIEHVRDAGKAAKNVDVSITTHALQSLGEEVHTLAAVLERVLLHLKEFTTRRNIC